MSLPQQANFHSVKTFCFIAGNPRTGSTLLASLIDAHPSVIMANETHMLDLFYYPPLPGRNKLITFLAQRAKLHAQSGKMYTGYCYAVPDQYQGKFAEPSVVGDKLWAPSIPLLHADQHLPNAVGKAFQAQCKIIHILRNPFDCIATMVKRSKLPLRDRIGFYFSICEAMKAVKARLGSDSYFEVFHEQLIKSPEQVLTEVCQFLQVEPDRKYLKDCSSIINTSAHQSRFDIEWSDEMKKLVENRVTEYDFTTHYSMEVHT